MNDALERTPAWDMTIDGVECWVLRAPVSVPVANAFGAMADRPAVFVRVTATDGAWGWGEAFANFPPVGAEHRARLVDSIFAPLVKGAPADPEIVAALLRRRTRQMAIQCGEPGPFAQVSGAIDQALWDLRARRAGLPLWRHLGGESGRVNVYASGIGPDGVAEMALTKRAEGFAAYKLKVGFSTERDRANFAAMRAALGDSATIMLDANQAWAAEEAVARITDLARWRPHWIEEPMLADHPLEVWRTVARSSAIPLAAGENLRGIETFAHAIDSGALAYVQPDVGKWGGISGCREVAQLAQQRNVTFCPHWLGGGLGLAASMHLLAAVGTAAGYAEVDANPNPLREDVFPFSIRDGAVTLTDAPGIGVEPDLARLSRFIVRW